MRSKLAVIAASAMLASTTVQAEPVSDVKATLKVFQWVNQQLIDSTESAKARFAKKYPNVTIETQFVPLADGGWGGYSNNFINEIAAGNPPDIFGVAIEGFAEAASKGVMLDLEEVAGKDPDIERVFAGIEANLVDGMRTRPGGTLNFFPTEWNNVVVYYNKDMFDAAGVDYPSADWSWEDFAKTAKALTKRDDGGQITQYGYYVPGYNFGLIPWFLTNSTNLLDEEWRTPQVNTPEFRETLEYLHTLINEHKAAPTFTAGVGDKQFVAGQVAMFSAGHWPLPELISGGLKNVGVQHMPMNKAKATVYGIGGIGITKYTKHADLAWEFIKEMTGDEFQMELAASQRSIPSARKHATSESWTAFPDNSKIFYESAATAVAVPSPPNYAQVNEIFMRHLTTYLNGNQDIDTTISQMDRELTRAMKRAYR